MNPDLQCLQDQADRFRKVGLVKHAERLENNIRAYEKEKDWKGANRADPPTPSVELLYPVIEETFTPSPENRMGPDEPPYSATPHPEVPEE